MKLKQTKIIAAIAAVALIGCQTPGSQVAKQSHEQLVTATVCCKTIGEAKVRSLPMQDTDLELSVASQAFNFEDGKAFFEVFQLPPYVTPYSILIGSRAAGTTQDRSVMAPRITLLDGNFQPTRHFDERTLRQRGGVLERTVFINPDDHAERYLVLYGSPIESSHDNTIGVVGVTPIFVGPGMFIMPTGSEIKSSLHYSPTGKYFLHIEGLQQFAQK